MRLRPARFSTRLTVAGDTPARMAMCLSLQPLTAQGDDLIDTRSWVGRWSVRGREDRSAKPAMLSAA